MARLSFLEFLRVQFTKAPPVLDDDLSQKTVVVVGANTGLGLETARHFANMKPGRLILGCRSKERGEAALQNIGYEKAELRIIDLAKFSSVKAFADSFEGDEKGIDVVVLNAAVAMTYYSETDDGWESTLQVNDLGTFYLSILLLPYLSKAPAPARLVVVASSVHFWTDLDKDVLGAPNLYKKLSEKEYCEKRGIMGRRYNDSKLFNVFFVRELSTRISSDKLVVSAPCPALCISDLRRDMTSRSFILRWLEKIAESIMFTSEEGSRNFIYCSLGKEIGNIHGQFLVLSKPREVSDFVLSEKGAETQKRVWDETMEILTQVDGRVPDILKKYLSS